VGNPATLYRFRISVSDIERSFYDDLDFRVAMHPSENEPYLLTRVIAYTLNYAPGLEFAPGLCTGDEPAIQLPPSDGTGKLGLWIDIGSPSPRKLNKATKAARAVRVYTYKDPTNLLAEISAEQVHRSGEIGIYSLPERYLESLAGTLERDNSWTLVFNEGELLITIGEESYSTPIGTHRLG
jgi:uncharacterized protein YaeQ